MLIVVRCLLLVGCRALRVASLWLRVVCWFACRFLGCSACVACCLFLVVVMDNACLMFGSLFVVRC